MEKQLIETLSTYQGVTLCHSQFGRSLRVCKNLWFSQKAKQLPTVRKHLERPATFIVAS